MAGQSRTLKLSILADVDQLKKSLSAANDDVENSGSKIGEFGKKAGLAFAAAGVAEQLRLAQDSGADSRPDAVVIACFGDPGLEAAREITGAPVLGIAEAGFHAASMLATGFSVVTTMTRTCIIAERLVQRYGFEHQCRGVHGTDIAVLDAGGGVIDQIEQTAREALSRDRSGAIVLGCAGMTTLCQTLTERLGVPVIDGVAVAVKFAEALAMLRLGTSKHGDYATPLPKVYTGWAAPFGWPKR